MLQSTAAMDKRFSEKSARIVIIDPGGSIRPVLSSALRSLGFQSIQGAASVEDCINHLTEGTVDWVIAPLLKSEAYGALYLLRLATETTAFRGTVVTLMLEEAETPALGQAFELGLFSWLPKPFTADSILAALTETLARLERHGWNTCLAAAESLRVFLKERQKWTSLLHFEERLGSTFPDMPQLLLPLAEAQILAGKVEDGRRTLSDARAVSDAFDAGAKEIEERYKLPAEATDDAASAAKGALKLDRCIVVEPDATSRASIVEMLKKLQVTKIEEFDDGQAAWDAMASQPEPSLVLLEWKLPRLSGPALLQRLRSHGFQTMPIVVVSSLVKRTDMPLAEEMGISAVVEKPFEREDLLSALVQALRQDKTPTTTRGIEMRIRKLLAARRLRDAQALRVSYLAQEKIPAHRKALIEAEFAFTEGEITKAKALAVTAIKGSNASNHAYSLLGRILLQLEEYDAAIKCFDRVRSFSPTNIARLCAMAEVYAKQGNTASADAVLTAAASIDPDSPTLKDAQLNTALTLGRSGVACDLMDAMESIVDVVAHLNNQAVLYARKGEPKKAVELYQNALEALPKRHADLEPILRYNLGLAYVRSDELEAAAKSFSLVQGTSAIKGKADSILKRINASLAGGGGFSLRETRSTKGDAAPDPSETGLRGFEITRGDVCAYLIFIDEEAKDETGVRVDLTNEAMQELGVICNRALGQRKQ